MDKCRERIGDPCTPHNQFALTVYPSIHKLVTMVVSTVSRAALIVPESQCGRLRKGLNFLKGARGEVD